MPIQAYSQKQLSSVGVSTDELKRFIQIPITNELANCDFEYAEIIKETRSTFLNLKRLQELQAEIDVFNLESTSLGNQVQHLRTSLGGINSNEQAIISKKTNYDAEGNLISQVTREINTAYSKVVELEQALINMPDPIQIMTQMDNADLITNLAQVRSTKFVEVKALITQLKSVLTGENLSEIRALLQQWKALKDAFDAQYEAAKSNTTSNQQQLIEIQRIESRLQQLQENINDRIARLREIGDPQTIFNTLRQSYWEIHRKKSSLLEEQAIKFSALSKNLIKVDVAKNLDLVLIKAELIKMLSGARISGDKLNDLCDLISSNEDPLLIWDNVLGELQSLSDIKPEDASTVTLPPCPNLMQVGFNDNNLRKIIENLTSDNWLNLATLKIEFSPDFKYTTNSELNDVIPFSEASAGQQATALLTVLLNQPGTPLLIDQPEDDIDNRAIDDIIKNIWEAKKHRQLIFTSHNANLVVNGDAELVICCDYRDSGSQTRGTIKAEGAIDSKAVKDEITSVMEGGEKAFKLRKDKYGF